ncbi:MAG: fibrobacter succinogenes major paralogous domain-containing protein, partial [Candidatus Magasanikbacteria bacterium]
IKEKEFKPLRIAILSQLVFTLILTQLGILVYQYYTNPSRTATMFLTQTNWGGGASTTLSASHLSDQTGWSRFYSTSSVDVNTSVAGEVSLSPSLNSTSQTSDTDFNTWATSSVFVSSTGSTGRIVLLKPLGAVCNQGSECSSTLCDGTTHLCYEPPCTGSTWSVTYSGVSYPLVLIGSQCWFAKNVNVGTMLAAGTTMPSNNSLIEKWCYNNSEGNCTAYGGLYTWAEMLQLATTCNDNSCTPSTNAQGICPTGWHIPTDAQFKTLEVYLGMCTGAGTGCVDAINQSRGDTPGVGTKLKSGGSSGFNMLLVGDRSYVNGGFNNFGVNGWYWVGSQVDATRGWYRQPSSGTGIYNGQISKNLGASVRCLLN